MRPRLVLLLAALSTCGCSAWNHPRQNLLDVKYQALVPLSDPRAASCAAACAPERARGPELHAACLSRCPGATITFGECGSEDVPPVAECATIHRTTVRTLPNRERTLELVGTAALGIAAGAVVGFHVGRIAGR